MSYEHIYISFIDTNYKFHFFQQSFENTKN